MVEIRKPISVSAAVEKVMRHSKEGDCERISFHKCDNRRLAEPIIATNPVPAFDKSPYDGFALRSSDTVHASEAHPTVFEVIEHIGAGELPEKKLQQGQATRIMTGAMIPDGADCVAMFEVCTAYEHNNQPLMSISRQMQPEQNIMKEGSEVKKGDTLIETGTLINPGIKALLATFGYHEVLAAKKPVVGVIATGTELLDVDEALEPGKIRNSNAYMVLSQIQRAGAEGRYLGKLADELEPGYEKMKQALEGVDILITTGGVSVGDFDLMPAIYEKLGADVLFNKIDMRPGSVTTVAVKGDQLLFGLSGNPSACYVGFELFTRPVLQTALYNKKPYLKRIQAKLGDDFPKPNPFSRFVRSYITIEQGEAVVRSAGMDKSNAVSSLAHTTCLMELPGGTSGYKADSSADVLLLNEAEGQGSF